MDHLSEREVTSRNQSKGKVKTKKYKHFHQILIHHCSDTSLWSALFYRLMGAARETSEKSLNLTDNLPIGSNFECIASCRLIWYIPKRILYIAKLRRQDIRGVSMPGEIYSGILFSIQTLPLSIFFFHPCRLDKLNTIRAKESILSSLLPCKNSGPSAQSMKE